jgi:hypothetical protein
MRFVRGFTAFLLIFAASTTPELRAEESAFESVRRAHEQAVLASSDPGSIKGTIGARIGLSCVTAGGEIRLWDPSTQPSRSFQACMDEFQNEMQVRELEAGPSSQFLDTQYDSLERLWTTIRKLMQSL